MYKHFETLYPHLIQRLRSEITEGHFAASTLFYGQRYSLRLSLVLETARILSCQGQGTAMCDCRSCGLFATSQMHNLYFFSNRNQEAELRTYATLYQAESRSIHLALLLQNIRHLQLRYQTLVLDEKSNRPISTTLIEQLQEALSDAENATQLGTRELKRLVSSAVELNTALTRSGVLSVNQIRALQLFCSRSTLDGSRRFIILEGLEESSEASRNSLLKFLEEPPADTTIFIISDNMALLNQTLLSRLRKYQVGPLTGEAVKVALEQLYKVKEPESYQSLEEFFLVHSGIEPKKYETLAKQFLHASFKEEPFDAQLFIDVDDEASFTLFLRAIGEESEALFTHGSVKREAALAINYHLRTVRYEVQRYNQSRRLALERLFYLLQEAV